jgi:Asp-tRNA(Asn)/Glu-tRNA(Gln) amidotransferase A subunit family amidase/Asp-tRNA(Asn)/Glu-tRNA(Gln) amidotransferase C subunit
MANSKKSSASQPAKFLDRREFIACLSGLGFSSAVLSDVLWAKVENSEGRKITKEIIAEVEHLIGLEFTDEERELMIDGLNRNLKNYEQIREVPLDNSVAPAIQFNPVVSPIRSGAKQKIFKISKSKRKKVSSNLEDIAFWTVTELAGLIKSRKISSLELTKMYLERLKKYDEKLKCVISPTKELAFEQARRADKEIATGRYRGPLHGIPWGAKDLLAVKGYKTTWGAMPFKEQVLDYDATVVKRLEESGAVLIAKLTLGALAMGDVWYGGKTRNPWNPEKGSSGSSAGPGSATSAGLVGFSIGSETLGSIVSPCTVCGVTGLRPTFGRVSRYGAMALSWSMDKLGPICRSVEDCALVFHAIHGPDGLDSTVRENAPFNWNPARNINKLKIGYLKSDFEKDRKDKKWKANDLATLDNLRSIGCNLRAIELPDLPIGAMRLVLRVEAAAAFDELTRSNRDSLLVSQNKGSWPNIFRTARMVTAVEYIQANRLRTLLIKEMDKLMSDIDVYVAPSWIGNNLALTNLSGHPTVVVPNGFNEKNEPTSITFTGRLLGETETLLVAKAYQDATNFHTKHPVL